MAPRCIIPASSSEVITWLLHYTITNVFKLGAALRRTAHVLMHVLPDVPAAMACTAARSLHALL